MEYQKRINLLNNEVTPPTKFRTKKWVECITLIVKSKLRLQF